MEAKAKEEMISSMMSVCKNCEHISVNDDIKRFVCKAREDGLIVMGVVLNCNDFKNKK